MKVHRNVEQGTLEWLLLRIAKPTASDFCKIITPTFARRSGAVPSGYLHEKVAEALLRRVVRRDVSAYAMEQGQVLEDEARRTFAFEHDCEIYKVGFIEAEDGRSGCSPDGICDDGFGVEIKCPEPAQHVGYLDEGDVPEKYVQQVHGSLYVSGLKEWRFMSYCRGLPPLYVTVKRDESIMRKIGDAIDDFHADFTNLIKRIKPNYQPCPPKNSN